jgi:hypothetical protein
MVLEFIRDLRRKIAVLKWYRVVTGEIPHPGRTSHFLYIKVLTLGGSCATIPPFDSLCQEKRTYVFVVCNVPSKLRGCAAAQYLKCSCAHWIVAAQLEFFISNCKYSYYANYKKVSKCRADVRSCKDFLLRAVAGPRSFEKIRENFGRSWLFEVHIFW